MCQARANRHGRTVRYEAPVTATGATPGAGLERLVAGGRISPMSLGSMAGLGSVTVVGSVGPGLVLLLLPDVAAAAA
jgi:hypothetical protein